LVEIGQTFLRGIFQLFTGFFDKDNGIVKTNKQVLTDNKTKKNFIDGIPTSVDWKKHNVLLPVKNQDICDSCYAFSALEAVSS